MNKNDEATHRKIIPVRRFYFYDMIFKNEK